MRRHHGDSTEARMNELRLIIGDRTFRADVASAIDLSIPISLRSDNVQLQAFGANKASERALQVDGFIGDVTQGGSCNCRTHTLTPHCNGTHTESIAHLTREPWPVTRLATALYLAELISVAPHHGVITADMLMAKLANLATVSAVVVRTLPNSIDKQTRNYDAITCAYFEPAALAWLAEQRIDHLLVDLPSVDPMADGGKLLAHRAFWGLPAGSQSLQEATRRHATITELIYVPNAAPDGRYVLNLNVAPLASDAAPSRPLLYPLLER
jgi:arylformamidase